MLEFSLLKYVEVLEVEVLVSAALSGCVSRLRPSDSQGDIWFKVSEYSVELLPLLSQSFRLWRSAPSLLYSQSLCGSVASCPACLCVPFPYRWALCHCVSSEKVLLLLLLLFISAATHRKRQGVFFIKQKCEGPAWKLKITHTLLRFKLYKLNFDSLNLVWLKWRNFLTCTAFFLVNHKIQLPQKAPPLPTL